MRRCRGVAEPIQRSKLKPPLRYAAHPGALRCPRYGPAQPARRAGKRHRAQPGRRQSAQPCAEAPGAIQEGCASQQVHTVTPKAQVQLGQRQRRVKAIQPCPSRLALRCGLQLAAERPQRLCHPLQPRKTHELGRLSKRKAGAAQGASAGGRSAPSASSAHRAAPHSFSPPRVSAPRQALACPTYPPPRERSAQNQRSSF